MLPVELGVIFLIEFLVWKWPMSFSLELLLFLIAPVPGASVVFWSILFCSIFCLFSSFKLCHSLQDFIPNRFFVKGMSDEMRPS